MGVTLCVTPIQLLHIILAYVGLRICPEATFILLRDYLNRTYSRRNLSRSSNHPS